MADSRWGDFTSGLLDIGKGMAAPLAQKWGLGGSAPSESKVVDDTIRYAGINGSGPANTTLAKQSPTSLWGFIMGTSVDPASGQPATDWKRLALVGAGLLLAGFVFFKLLRR